MSLFEMELYEFFASPIGSCILFGLVIFLFIWKSRDSNNIWKKKGVPHVKSYPIFGSLLETISGKKPLHEIELERYKRLGPVYGFIEGTYTMLTVADPKLLRNILVKDFQFFINRRTISTGDNVVDSMVNFLEGEDWKRVRTIVTPTFTTGKIKRMMDIFTGCSKVLVENFKTLTAKGEPVDVKKAYGAFTMDIIASAAFSTKIDSLNDPNNKFVQVARSVFFKQLNYRFVFYVLFPRIMKLFKIAVFPPEGVKFFSEVTQQIMNERRRTGQKGNDFLQLLMDTMDERKSEDKHPDKDDDVLSNYKGDTNDQVFKNVQSKGVLSFNELVAQCVIFFLAGFETTASALAFISYQCALNPDIQDKLFREIKESVERNNGQLTYEAVQGMKYLDNVISETFRLTPPSIRLERVASDEYTLGDTGITIPRGTVITIPIYAIQRDPKYFPNPEKFDPDRFLPEERAQRDPYTFMPFGTGPRNCIGMRFALIEIKVCLAYIISNFRIKRCPETKVPLHFLIGQGLLQPKDITVLLEIRENCPLKN